MKRNKLFLGFTACALAVAGIAVSKAAKFHTLYTRYFCTKEFNSFCFVTRRECKDDGTPLCTVWKNINGTIIAYTLYHLNKNYLIDGCASVAGKCFDLSPSTKTANTAD